MHRVMLGRIKVGRIEEEDPQLGSGPRGSVLSERDGDAGERERGDATWMKVREGSAVGLIFRCVQ